MEKKEDYLSKLFSVENKIAIVTGASRGNGKAISEGLLKAGATVILVDILEKELELTEETREKMKHDEYLNLSPYQWHP